MENSTSDNDANQTFRSPPRRRRSTFFERRDSVVPTHCNTPETDLKNNIESLTRTQEMNSYFKKLLSEKEQWKKEVKERRNKYHDLRQQYKMTATAGSSKIGMLYTTLSNEDIEFLKAKPNISKLVDSQQRLHRSTKIYTALVSRVIELQQYLLDHCEDKVIAITNHILETSTID